MNLREFLLRAKAATEKALWNYDQKAPHIETFEVPEPIQEAPKRSEPRAVAAPVCCPSRHHSITAATGAPVSARELNQIAMQATSSATVTAIDVTAEFAALAAKRRKET